jgi:hypothetical protein
MSAEHPRAVELMSAPPVSLSHDARSWLARHIETCPSCRDVQAALSVLGAAFGSEPASAPPGLVQRTKAAVRRRVADREAAVAGRTRTVLAACLAAAAVAWLAAAAWTVDWLGRLAGLSRPACWLAQASLWTLVGLLAAVAGLAAGERPSPVGSVSGGEGGRR